MGSLIPNPIRASSSALGWHLLGAAALWLWCAFATAGTLTKANVEAMFPNPMLVGEMLEHLPVWPVFIRTGQGPELQNFVFETIDLEPVAGYGGKPINVMVVMDRDGTYVTSRLLSHMEPLFRSEEGTATLAKFTGQYQGVTVHHQVHILGAKAQRNVTPTVATLHGVVAGTVTANAIDRSVMESAAQVAQAQSDPTATQRKAADSSGSDDRYQRTGFNGLAASRLVQRWSIDHRALERDFTGTPVANRDAVAIIRPQGLGVDMWLCFAGIPQAGRNLLDASRWREVRTMREQSQPVLMVMDGGRYPLEDPASSTLPRGATISLKQNNKAYTLKALPWQKGLRVSGQHSGVSATSQTRYYSVEPASDGTRLDVLSPVEMTLSVWRRPGDGARDVVQNRYERRFEIPEAQSWAPTKETPKWLEPWGQRLRDLVVLGIALAVLTVALVWQRKTAASVQRLRLFRIPFLLFTLGFIGWYAQGQLTIVSLTSLIEALVAGRSTQFLLADPMAVVLWIFTFVTLLIWGRGTFCGWLCPFGALQELIALLAQRLGFAQKRLRMQTDRWLKRVKYVVLVFVLGAATASVAWTEAAVEVEPFKTAISTYFDRSWPYIAWAVACLLLGVFVYRGYCRYICPLGAALAVLGRLRIFAWIPRRNECGTPCQTCRHRCEYQAIEPTGKVDYAECFQCLDCVQTHDDTAACLPLVRQTKGKTIPIHVMPTPGLEGQA